MSRYERSIQVAVDTSTGEVVKAVKLLSRDAPDRYLTREKDSLNEVRYECYECGQRLHVATSKGDNLHFRHSPKSEECVLKGDGVSRKDERLVNGVIQSKESQRHKDLKNKLGQHLMQTEGVDKDSVLIDNRFLIRKNGKRRPDVYCKYHDREIVFEIQLSLLPISYIIGRHRFYKENGIYLVWILNEFDIKEGQRAFEKDIKYLTEYQNFFHVDELVESFRLVCDYKVSYIVMPELELRDHWKEKSVNFNQLKFNSQNYQVYYKNFEQTKALKQGELDVLKEEKRRKREGEIIASVRRNSQAIKSELRFLLSENRKGRYRSFEPMIDEINELTTHLDVFNEVLGFYKKDESGKPFMFKVLGAQQKDDRFFIESILDCDKIQLDVNEQDTDGTSLLKAFYDAEFLGFISPVKSLFKRGYSLTVSDNELLTSTSFPSDLRIRIEVYDRLQNKNLIESAYDFMPLLYMLESISRKEIVGYGWKSNEWLQFANYMVRNHQNQWRLLECALQRFKLWPLIMNLDKRGTFIGKVEEARANDYNDNDKVIVRSLVADLYPVLSEWENIQ